MTLLRYFPSKAHLALAPLEDVLHAFTDRLADPARSEDAITIWRRHVRTEAVRHQEVAAGYLTWVDGEPVLRARLESLTTEHEDAMAAALAADAGTEADDLRAILLASTLVRGNAAVTRRWIGRGGCAGFHFVARAGGQEHCSQRQPRNPDFIPHENLPSPRGAILLS